MFNIANHELNNMTGVCINDVRGKYDERKNNNRTAKKFNQSARDHAESLNCLPS